MHIPEQMLHGAICPVTAGVALAGLGGAAFAVRKSQENPQVARFALVSAFIFAAQMLNYPVLQGTSGHLIGASLAVFLLGPAWGVLSLALVLSVQALLFGDGGVSVLGANILNMAIIAALPAILWERYKDRFSAKLTKSLMQALASYSGVILACLACCIELVISKAAEAQAVFSGMLAVHSLIALGETAITLAMVYVFRANKQGLALQKQPGPALDLRAKKPFSPELLPGFLALILAVFLSPLASSSPDGLESVASKLGFLQEGLHPIQQSPFNGYLVQGLQNDAFATLLAAALGSAGLFALAGLLAFMVKTGKRKNA